MDIKERVVEKTVSELKEKYNDIIESIVPYLETYVSDIFETELTNVDKDAKIKKTYLNVYRTKKRWTDKIIEEYKQYQNNTLSIKKVKTYAMLIERYNNHLLEEVNSWQANKEQHLLAFPCFETLSTTQKRQSLEKETIILLGEFYKQEEKKEKKVYESVNSMIDLPIFGSGNKNKLALNQKKKFDEGENSFYAIDKFPGNTNFNEQTTMYVDERFLTSFKDDESFLENLNAMVPDLNSQDYELFNEVLQFRDNRFKWTHTIEVPIQKLVEITFKKQHYSKKHYDIIKKRLLKLGYYRVTRKNEQGDIYLYGAFSDVSLTNRDGVDYASCTLTNTIYNAFLNHEITSIYNEELPQLKGSIAYKLVFYLQKERLIAYQAGIKNPVRIEWRSFLKTIRLIGRRKKEKMKELSDALDQIKKLGIILKDYYLSGDFFYLTFDDLSVEELQGHEIQIASNEPKLIEN